MKSLHPLDPLYFSWKKLLRIIQQSAILRIKFVNEKPDENLTILFGLLPLEYSFSSCYTS